MSTKALKTLILSVVIVVSAIFSFNFGRKADIFYGDALGYYLYLPATFIYHNLGSIGKYPDNAQIPEKTKGHLNDVEKHYLRTPKGIVSNQYTYGIALMEAPFFFVAHMWEKARLEPHNGYSTTYQNLIKFGNLFYALAGLVLTYRVLRKHFSELISLITVACIFIGTNLFWFSLHQAGMAHVPLFFLYAALIYQTVKVHETPSLRAFLLLGVCIGLIILIRPSDIVAALIPFLYKVYNKDTLLQRLRFIKEHTAGIGLTILVVVAVWIPQVCYWKFISGSWFFDSYGSQSFNWRTPKIIEGIFHASNGWLFYSTVMAFSIIGFLFYRTIRDWAWSIYLLFPLYVYVVYSWFCYNYINGLGSRPMIHIYPLLAIPFAALVQYVLKSGLLLKLTFAVLSIFFAAVNISYSMQQSKGILNSEESNIAFNMQMLFKMHLDYNDLVVKDIGEWQPDTTKLQKVALLALEDFEDSLSANYMRDTHGTHYIYALVQQEYPEQNIELEYTKDLIKDAEWLKCSARVVYTENSNYYKHLLQIDIRIDNDFLMWKGCKLENKIKLGNTDSLTLWHGAPHNWEEVSFFVRVPKFKEGYKLTLTIWNLPRLPLFIDYMKLESYKRK